MSVVVKERFAIMDIVSILPGHESDWDDVHKLPKTFRKAEANRQAQKRKKRKYDIFNVVDFFKFNALRTHTKSALLSLLLNSIHCFQV